MSTLDESIIQVLTVGGNNVSGTAKVQPLTITGGPPWLKQQVTEEAPEKEKTKEAPEKEKTNGDEAAVLDALKTIAKGKTFDEWAKTAKVSPEIKAEVKSRLDAEEEGNGEGEEESPKHDKDHITKAMFDTLPDDEKEGHHDELRSSMKHHGFENGEEEDEEGGEEDEEELDYEGEEEGNYDGDLDQTPEPEEKPEPKVKEEPKMKLSKKKEKVTVNPKLEQKAHNRKRLIEDLKAKRKKRFEKHVKSVGKEEDLPDIEKKVEKNINIQHPNDIEDHNRKQGYKEERSYREGLPTRELIKKQWKERAIKSKEKMTKKISHPGYEEFANEEAPPGREHQVKALKKKVGTDKAYAFAWAQHNKHGKPVDEANEMENLVGHRSTPLEVIKTLKDKVDAKDPTAMEGNNWSEFENERLQQLERMVRPGANVLMFMDKPVGHYELEEYVFVMRDKIPKYVEMGYKIVAE